MVVDTLEEILEMTNGDVEQEGNLPEGFILL